jgi:hypothetical protein
MKIFQTIFVVGLAAWTGMVILGPLDAAMTSFVHLINLVFHEAGHIIFSPFGEFLTGSAPRSASGGPAKA